MLPTAAAVALAVLAGTAATATAVPAAPALHYKCATSTRTIDDAGYSGPAPDNWDVKVSLCAARSGQSVYTYADVRWNGPALYANFQATILDGAKLRLQIKLSREGTDPVVTERDFDLRERMERATSRGDHDGSYRTPVISGRAGSGAYGGGVLFLDWHKDGRGFRGHDFDGTPVV